MKRKSIVLTSKNMMLEAELNIFRWYDFSADAKVLIVGLDHVPVKKFCEEQGFIVFEAAPAILLKEGRNAVCEEVFDYVIMAETLEALDPDSAVLLLKEAYSCLKNSGILLVTAHNRYAISHFCGEKTPYEGELLQELEGQIGKDGYHCYGLGELESLFVQAGIGSVSKFAVFPSLRNAKKIYSFSYKISNSFQCYPWYEDNSLIFAREENMYPGLVSSGLFYPMANGFFLEARKDGGDSAVLFATVSSQRPADRQSITVARTDGTVQKRPIYENGMANIRQLEKNHAFLKNRGMHVVPGKLKDDAYEMQYVHSPGLLEQIRTVFYRSREEAEALFDAYVEELRKSSEIRKSEKLGEVLEHGFIDLIPFNCFYDQGRFVFYDQEYDIPDLPLRVIIYRFLIIVYHTFLELDAMLPMAYFLDRYGVSGCMDEVRAIEEKFRWELNAMDLMEGHKRLHEPLRRAIEDNRRKMNQTGLAQQRLAKERAAQLEAVRKQNCFEGLEGKRVFVFGAGGVRGRKFFSFYGDEVPVEAVLDNNEKKWGTTFFGVPVKQPDFLKDLDPDGYKVIIVTREPAQVLGQLARLGAKQVGIYDWERIYPGRQGICSRGGRPYHIGYVAGVFDLFHVGHVNLLRRAKEQCDYLIAGVSADAYVRNRKGKEPVVPFEERLQMVRSCRYVDEAAAIPYEFRGTVEAFQKYHFDVQFSGSDYKDDPWWLGQKEWLREHGADLVFFPYTEQTNSTKIRSILDKEIMKSGTDEEGKRPQQPEGKEGSGGIARQLEGKEGSGRIVQQPDKGKEADKRQETDRYQETAYYQAVVNTSDHRQMEQLTQLRRKYGRLVIGIPGNAVLARIFGGQTFPKAEKTKEELEKMGCKEVVVLDAEMLSRRVMYRQLHFSTCFYGSEYGEEFQKDQEFFALVGVKMQPCIPGTYCGGQAADSMKITLLDQKRHKIILFGAGVYFEHYMRHYGKEYPPAYAVDNDPAKWGSVKDGVRIYPPSALADEHTDACLLVLCSRNYDRMREQAFTFGDFNYRTLRYDDRIALLDEFSIAVRREKQTVKNIQDILVQMAAEFDRVCRKYRLHYYAICGTLIGALRHRDMIPWDDDLDVAMPRADFEKLREVAGKEWAGSAYELLLFDAYGGGAFLDFMPRVIYKNSRQPVKVFDKVLGKATADIRDRVFLDIYIMDNASDNEQKHVRTIGLMKKVYGLCMGHRAYVDFQEYERKNTKAFIRQLKVAVKVGKMLPAGFLIHLYDWLSRRYQQEQTEDYFMPSCAITCIERRFPKSLFGEGKRVPFRDIEIMIPDDADGLMEAMGYHGYMTPIAEYLRKPSHYFNSDIVIW